MTENTLAIYALGGMNEIGKNMYVIECEEDIFIIDCGAKFANNNLLGVDLIVPDITYLQQQHARIRALIVTHGHEDHIGGIPYVLQRLNVPIYASRFTLGLIELKLKEHKLLRDTQLIEIDENASLQFSSATISFFNINHSIPDCLGIVFQTAQGNIVHTGDFKFDFTPVNDKASDIHKMAAIGERGVLALISESTNAERPGMTPSEQLVGENLKDAFTKATNKIFVTTFASNVNRIQQIVEATIDTNRRLVLLGRSMVNVVSVAIERGYLRIPHRLLVDVREAQHLAPEQIVVLCTGSQGEPLAALARLANGRQRDLQVHQNDTVIFATSPIPGNEKNVSKIIDDLFYLGANVIYGSASTTGMHVSGHGYQEDLKLMLTLMKPKYLIPIHGEYRMLYKHRQLAQSVGVEAENIFILKNGEVVDFIQSTAQQTRLVHAGETYVDGVGTGEVENIVLRDRQQLAEDGMLVIVLTLDQENGQPLAAPDTISRGFVYAKNAEGLLLEINDLVLASIQPFKDINIRGMQHAIKKSVGQYLFTVTRKKPMILPIIIAV
ncbi:ribonuclease J [Metasolibacillus fluoroglycofenilyticus]|uniref:ribonuclease J n=1 Tax=Metasolibacillus fluoroglycofenilyticus TaxID=1239396 RepID=UPI001F317C7A|nr:ribonuclease J [Metasolibacillus fluoroglycofenilyticus]